MSQQELPISLYKSSDGSIQLEVKLEDETIWLSQEQLAKVFEIERSVITKHINNIYKTAELQKNQTSAIFAQVQQEGKRKVKRNIVFYNLDMIISVGYRVNSLKATQFRVWATNVLKQYALQGYSINPKIINDKKIKELSQIVDLIKETINKNNLSVNESSWLLEIITQYTQSWILFYQFDTNSLHTPEDNINDTKYWLLAELAYQEINKLKERIMEDNMASNLFGTEKYHWALESIIWNIYQTYWGKDVYSTRHSKAAHLLYFVIKDHPFNDGNKRIWAFLFILFLRNYSQLYNPDWSLKINDRGLVAITLLIAQSSPKDKNLMVQLVMNLIS
jgi:prophage maintenance system killer protein/prophage antirepressor-like protein